MKCPTGAAVNWFPRSGGNRPGELAGFAHDAVVAVHHALGRAGGAGGVGDQRPRRRIDRQHALQRLVGEQVLEARRIAVDDRDNGDAGGQFGLENHAPEALCGDECLRPGVGEDVGQLFSAVEVNDGYHHRTQQRRRPERRRGLHPVRQPECDHVTGTRRRAPADRRPAAGPCAPPPRTNRDTAAPPSAPAVRHPGRPPARGPADPPGCRWSTSPEPGSDHATQRGFHAWWRCYSQFWRMPISRLENAFMVDLRAGLTASPSSPSTARTPATRLRPRPWISSTPPSTGPQGALALVIRGGGDRAFVSGGDLKELAQAAHRGRGRGDGPPDALDLRQDRRVSRRR